MISPIQEREEITIPKSEYNLLNEVYNQFKKQALLFRIIEAERNLKRGKVEEMNFSKFVYL
ncbi:MAG: hypothetical protein KAQ87_01500 [Candidatus Pacebacteria bacterium]|nr:hypothetical protein [Candidatus Paceibacterota bacterium]